MLAVNKREIAGMHDVCDRGYHDVTSTCLSKIQVAIDRGSTPWVNSLQRRRHPRPGRGEVGMPKGLCGCRRDSNEIHKARPSRNSNPFSTKALRVDFGTRSFKFGISANRRSGYTEESQWSYATGPTRECTTGTLRTHGSAKEKIQLERWSGARLGVLLVSHVLSIG